MHVELEGKLKEKSERNSLGRAQCPDFEHLVKVICRVQVPSRPSGNVFRWPGGRKDLCGTPIFQN